jgi:CubicO group peptidase (beta-lactamase class C family)
MYADIRMLFAISVPCQEPLMRLRLFGFVICFFLAGAVVKAQSASLPRSSPEKQGVATAQIVEFIETANQKVQSMHSFMLLRNGHVVAEAWWHPESKDKPHVLWSLSKSFTSTAVGLAVAEGKLSIDDRVVSFFPDFVPKESSNNLQSMRVRDLLTMSTGHQDEVNLRTEKDWTKAFLAHPVPHKPGTHFKYNTPATYMQSAIVQKVTGEKVVDYLQSRLFQPLGIVAPKWDESPEGISLGGYGLYLKTEDIAKFGQLLLQKGKWNGKQIVPSQWIEQATSKQVSNGSDPSRDWDQGYGFQFWRCRHNAFRGDGKDGQFCIVLPDQNAVVAITANTSDMQAELNVVWDKLLPAFRSEPLPENPTEVAKLVQLTEQLKATK